MARGQDEELPTTFTEEVKVRIQEVEVVATDRRGNPVLGLDREDFRLLVDGDEVEIANFYAVEAGVRRVADGEEEAVAAVAAPTHLVLLIDSLTLPPMARNRLLKDLDGVLERLVDASDGMMVANLGRRLQLEGGFTRDLALLRQRLAEVTRRADAMNPIQARRYILRDIEQGPSPEDARRAVNRLQAEMLLDRVRSDASSSLSDIRSHAASVFHGLQTANQVTKNFVASLSGVPGRKAVLFVSSGFEVRPGELLFRTWWDKYHEIARDVGVLSVESEIGQFDAAHELDRMVSHANANSVSFYVVDPGGRGQSPIDSEIRSVGTSDLARAQAFVQAGALEYLAYGTGGLALTTSTNVDRFVDDMSRGFESFYSLGFVNGEHRSGRSRKVEVKVDVDGVRLRHSRGFLDKSADERMEERTLASLYFDESNNPLQVGIELGEERQGEKKGLFTVSVVVKVPISNLTLVPDADHHVGRLSVVFVAQDERGVSKPVRVQLPIRIPNAQLLQALSSAAAYEARLAMRSGEQKLAIGVRDEIGEELSTVNLVASVGRANGSS